MKALTLWRPWPWAIFGASYQDAKDVENRGWAPPESMIGQQIAIHAGRKYDDDAADDIACDLGLDELPPSAHNEGVVGVVTIDRIIYGGRCGSGLAHPKRDPAFKSCWYMGPFGWVLRDRIRLPVPVQCRGFQGLWTLADETERLVREQLMTP